MTGQRRVQKFRSIEEMNAATPAARAGDAQRARDSASRGESRQ
jgi:hypothetical protein